MSEILNKCSGKINQNIQQKTNDKINDYYTKD